MSTQFFVIEGPDGVGKTTLIKKIEEYFNTCTSYNCFSVSPSNNNYGKQIKELIKNNDLSNNVLISLQESTLKHLYETELLPLSNLENSKNTIVLIDRWVPSLFVYQYSQNIYNNSERIRIYTQLKERFKYYETFILDTDDSVLDDRLGSREENEKFEDKDFQIKVRKEYRTIPTLATNTTRVVLNGSLEENFKTLLSVFLTKIK